MSAREWRVGVVAGFVVAVAALAVAGEPEGGVVALPAPAPAAVEAAKGESKVILDWPLFRELTKYERAAVEEPKLTLPWKDVEDLLGVKVENVEGAELTLDWRQFKALLKWSVEQKKAPVAVPADYVVSSSAYEGTLRKEGATLELTLLVNVLKEDGWKRIQLLPATVALEEATLPQGCFLNVSGGNYEMLTLGKGPMEIKLKFAVAVSEQAGAFEMRFNTLPAGTTVLKLTVPQDNVKIDVAGAQAVLPFEPKPGQTTVGASLPSGQPVQVTWERALEAVEKLPPKLYAETRTLVAVGDGFLSCRGRVDLNVLHSGIRSVALALPEQVNVLEVTGSSVQDWRAADRTLEVRFAHDVIGSTSFSIIYERAAANEQAAMDAPILRLPDAVREKGFIGVVALANVELTAPQPVGATAVDVRELPAEILQMTNQPVLLAFRYIGKELTIPLLVKKHEDVPVLVTLVDSAVLTTLQTMDGRRITKAIYNVRNNRNQFLRLRLPEEAEVWTATVAGKSIRPALDEQGRVLIPLVRSGAERVELSSFPVELVYVEKQKEIAEKGKMHIALPRASEPVTHLMVQLYLPPEGRYSARTFEGPLRLVEQFTRIVSAPQPPEQQLEAAAQAQQLQEQFTRRVEQEAAVAGMTPIRVELPIRGQLFRLEKILVLDEELWIAFQYSGWKK